MKFVSLAFALGPFLFGVFFLGPLFAALISTAGVTWPFAMQPLGPCIVVGGLLGLVAMKRKTWLW